MRTHSQIIADAGGVTPVRKKLLERGLVVSDPTLRSWASRPKDEGTIPPEFWAVFVELGFAESLEELQRVAAERNLSKYRQDEVAA